ncbi:MAG: response regulator, partial [Halobacteriaceae archaeon]
MDGTKSGATETAVANANEATVLIVEDDQDLADTYGIWLENNYNVEIAYDGEQALELIDETFDVVLLDRRMPGLSGDDVLERIRSRSVDCQVSMITAVEPDPDIVDLPFDEYLVKPIRKQDLVDVVDELLLREEFEEKAQEYFALSSTTDALEERGDEDLWDQGSLHEIKDRLAELGEEEAIQQQAEELDRLKRINDLVRDVNRIVVQANTRGEIEDQVCELLVDKGPYQFA